MKKLNDFNDYIVEINKLISDIKKNMIDLPDPYITIKNQIDEYNFSIFIKNGINIVISNNDEKQITIRSVYNQLIILSSNDRVLLLNDDYHLYSKLNDINIQILYNIIFNIKDKMRDIVADLGDLDFEFFNIDEE